MMTDGDRLPDLLLEQYALGELKGAEKTRFESRLGADPDLRGRLEALSRSDGEILAELPPAEIAASIRRRMLSAGGPEGTRKPGKGRFLPTRAVAFPAAAAILIVAGAVAARGLFPPSRGEIVLAKGGAPGLVVYKKSASGPTPLADGALASAGDLLQIKYASGNARYGAIASLDGRGGVTWHLPSEYAPAGSGGRADKKAGALAPRIEMEGAALGSAYELDDAPAFERFFILSSNEDFELSLVSRALGELARSGDPEKGRPDFPAGIECKSFLLRKTGSVPLYGGGAR
jgi:hypothetical protein